ncbi:DUF418 domain-containing protein [Streptomyces sp. NPDC004539]|uniref:DUF418 domain-containing protein n=1 Tax=Streptomyces sp. NPDC004539 TaxID=3154280 RepID=UPI0033B15C89
MQKANTVGHVASLDVLRGLAVIGTLLTNIWIFAPAGWDSYEIKGEALTGLFSETWQTRIADISTMVSNGKFLSLLSILFGVGMAIQFESALRRGHRWPWRYEWRSLLLLADGFLHFALVFEFDILMGYALVAMVVAPLLRLRTRWLVAATALAGAFHLVMEYRSVLSTQDHSARELPPDASTTGDRVPLPEPVSYVDEVANRLGDFWNLRSEAFVIAPPLSAFLFLTGVLLWRAGLFTADARARRLSVWLAAGGLGAGVPLTVWPALGLPGGDVLVTLSRYTVAPVVAFGYLGLVLVLLRRGGGTGFLGRRFAAVGRTALSCYMLQNVLAMAAFNSWGLRLGPLDSVGTVLAWAVISGILMLAASLWLRRFPQGPFELVWRAAVEAPFRRRDRGRAEEAAAGRERARKEHVDVP